MLFNFSYTFTAMCCKLIEINRSNKQLTDLQDLHKYIVLNVCNYPKSIMPLLESPCFHSLATHNYTYER
jgi:hypothetical protein